MKGQRVLVVGATSSIARAAAVRFALEGASVYLAARDAEEVDRIARDIEIRSGARVEWCVFRTEDHASHAPFVANVSSRMGGLDLAFVALGTLGDQRRAETDFSHAEEMLEGNLTGVVSLLTPIANYFEAQKRGAIVVIGSVAGDRGRQGNYIYAAAKAGLHTFLQGLRARLFRSGVRVVTVKPGFVDTKMIFGRPGVFLAASPDQVAADILSGLKKGRDIIYTPFFWSPVMLILRHIPERLFKRLTV